VKPPPKHRADLALVDRGLAESQAQAQALILAGLVYSDTKRIDKAGDKIGADQPLSLKGQDHPYVSRGGLKLAHGLDAFGIDPAGHICLDIGSSTGGFTDVLLRRGAAKVYAVDAGTNQLAWKLRQDPRVVVMERTNARTLTRDLIPEAPSIIVCDASFIRLQSVLPAGLSLAAPNAHLIALIKPQFEVARGEVEKGGVVRDPTLHQAVCTDTQNWLESDIGWKILGLTESPILGPEGNKEFLIGAKSLNPA
jgi:23S rRNA (cytidine1920-2'-O)/16S rRNA (cytidine1409-2'-O)-methyltransferase